MDLEAKAEISGWGKAYATNPDFKAIFDEMHEVLDALPPPLHARGKSFRSRSFITLASAQMCTWWLPSWMPVLRPTHTPAPKTKRTSRLWCGSLETTS
ncbi:hypothetical protein BCL79_0814 [Stenotrophomonas rhizophila]|uniref:Uncharacterized protein n=1 Tax=Stenotrophomonas rhizophila TaxID=216778 RepID=A0A498CFI7_9GAMM|nr:hypothetical protein BCL79_0814 [Stenotrophomonas rhizophila]